MHGRANPCSCIQVGAICHLHSPGAKVGVLNLAAVESALRELQRVFPEINRGLLDRRDYLDDEVLLNMLDGYAFVDQLISERIDILEMGHSSYWLKLNALVLCGANPERLARHHRMLEA